MKFLGKSFAVAAMALAVSTAAEARFQTIGDTTADGSELAFNLVDYTAKTSYTLDLGFTIAQFLANPSQTLSFTINDSNFASFVAAYTAGNNAAWGVNGGYISLNTEADLPIFGFYTTSVSAAPAIFDQNAAEINNTFGKWDGMVNGVNPVGLNSANTSHFRVAGQGGYTAVYGNDFQGALPFLAQGQIGADLSFVHEMVNATDFDTGELAVLPGKWNFSFIGNVGTLKYSVASTPSQVPLPAAVWMFGAGLMALLGFNRRKAV